VNADTQALKDWTTVRARAALLRIQAYRSDPADGPPCFFSVVNGTTTRHVDLQALRRLVEELEEDHRS
jgi:hypothetical protein